MEDFKSYLEELRVFTALREEPLETFNVTNTGLSENIKTIFKTVAIFRIKLLKEG